MKILMIIGICIYLQACTTIGSVDRPQNYSNTASNLNEQSIINSTSEELHDDKINSLLYQQVKFPKKIRIAILRLSTENSWRFYSNDFTELNDSISENLIDKLRSSERVYDASFLPSMLVPEKRTLAVIREAAARFQADALLVYRSSCSSYQKYRFISRDETKSYCSVEAIVLDVRKGIVGKSIVTIQEFIAKNNNKDMNFSETIKKAELEALARALGEIANEVATYLNKVSIL